jgi:hypothetical protein
MAIVPSTLLVAVCACSGGGDAATGWVKGQCYSHGAYWTCPDCAIERVRLY